MKPHGIPDNYIQTGPDEWSAPSRRNQAIPAGIRPDHPQPAKGSPLVGKRQRKEAGGNGAQGRFEITFTVHAVSPADWDGYDIKSLQDWCVIARLIPGDGWKTLSGRVYSCKAHAPEEEGTEITIEQIDGGRIKP